MFGGACNPVFTQFYSAESASLKNFWRIQVAALYMIVPVAIEAKYKPFDWSSLSLKERVRIFMIAPFYNLLWGQIAIFAAKFTLLSHANLLGNSCGIFVLLLNLLFHKRIHWLEVYGSLIALGGAVLMMFDPDA